MTFCRLIQSDELTAGPNGPNILQIGHLKSTKCINNSIRFSNNTDISSVRIQINLFFLSREMAVFCFILKKPLLQHDLQLLWYIIIDKCKNYQLLVKLTIITNRFAEKKLNIFINLNAALCKNHMLK